MTCSRDTAIEDIFRQYNVDWLWLLIQHNTSQVSHSVNIEDHCPLAQPVGVKHAYTTTLVNSTPKTHDTMKEKKRPSRKEDYIRSLHLGHLPPFRKMFVNSNHRLWSWCDLIVMVMALFKRSSRDQPPVLLKLRSSEALIITTASFAIFTVSSVLKYSHFIYGVTY